MLHTHTHKYVCWYVWLYEKREWIRVRQTAVRYTQQNKQTNMHNCVSVYVYVYEERERINVTLVTTAAQACASALCMCVCACVCWYCFANPSNVSVCLPVHTVTQTHTHTHTSNTKNTGNFMSRNDRKSILSLKHSISVLSHAKHTLTHWSDESPAKMSDGRADNWHQDK